MGIFSNLQKTQDLIFGNRAKRVVKEKSANAQNFL